MRDDQKWEIIQGDALRVLSGFAPNTFDAVITDPPYASGGRTQAEKNKSTARKYSSIAKCPRCGMQVGITVRHRTEPSIIVPTLCRDTAWA